MEKGEMAWGENGKGRDGIGRKWKTARLHGEKMEERARWHGEKMEKGEMARRENGKGRNCTHHYHGGELAWGRDGKGQNGTSPY